MIKILFKAIFIIMLFASCSASKDYSQRKSLMLLQPEEMSRNSKMKDNHSYLKHKQHHKKGGSKHHKYKNYR